MLSWIREKFGTVVIGGIIGFIAFVFVFYGVFNPKATRGLHEGAVAGTVNGDAIAIGEFQRALNQRLEFFKNLSGGNAITEEQMKMFRIRDGVFDGLVRRKLLVQEALKQGLEPSLEEIRQRIQEIPAFQKDGRFDLLTYKQMLEANRYTAASFERMMKEDLAAQAWEGYFKNRVQVSEQELQKHFLVSETKKNIKYVLLTSESARRGLQVGGEDVSKFLSDSNKLKLVQARFDQRKDSEFKGKKFEDVKEQIVRDLILSERSDEARKLNEGLADKVLGLMAADKGRDAKINELLKPYKVEVKQTGLVSQLTASLPGLGELPELMADAFSEKSPIDSAQAGKAKKYSTGPWIVVALVTETKKADPALLSTEREKLFRDLSQRKERELYEAWMEALRKKAKIDKNPAVVGEGEA